jgi:stearoyl-CoA desaturase (delta-9 desaturase)
MKDKIIRYMAPSLAMSSIFQLLFFYAVYLGIDSGLGWGWWLTSVLCSFFIYSMIGNNIGLHRYFTHGHFTVSKPVEYLFLWCGSMTGLGSPLSYAITHYIHHDARYTDTGMDPHGPIRGWKSLLVWFQKAVDTKETPVINKRLVELTRKYSWVHRFYVPLFLLNALILYTISYKLFLFCWFIPAGLSCWGIAFAVIRQHFNLKPQNTPLANIDFSYEGLHYNHHLYPRAPNTAVNPGEIDWTYQLSKIFNPTYDWRGQPNHVQVSDQT